MTYAETVPSWFLFNLKLVQLTSNIPQRGTTIRWPFLLIVNILTLWMYLMKFTNATTFHKRNTIVGEELINNYPLAPESNRPM